MNKWLTSPAPGVDSKVVDTEGKEVPIDGENIKLVEVENIPYIHPAVRECAVIAMPDKKWGEIPKATVTLKPNAQATEKELIDICSNARPPSSLPNPSPS